MSSTSRLLSLAKSLHPSPLRQAGAPQLSDAIESIVNRSFPNASTEAGPSTSRALSTREEQVIEGMSRPLERLKTSQALLDYPLSARTLRPRHDPQLYSRLVIGVHRSQQGIGRSWFRRFFQLRGDA